MTTQLLLLGQYSLSKHVQMWGLAHGDGERQRERLQGAPFINTLSALLISLASKHGEISVDNNTCVSI